MTRDQRLPSSKADERILSHLLAARHQRRAPRQGSWLALRRLRRCASAADGLLRAALDSALNRRTRRPRRHHPRVRMCAAAVGPHGRVRPRIEPGVQHQIPAGWLSIDPGRVLSRRRRDAGCQPLQGDASTQRRLHPDDQSS